MRRNKRGLKKRNEGEVKDELMEKMKEQGREIREELEKLKDN